VIYKQTQGSHWSQYLLQSWKIMQIDS